MNSKKIMPRHFFFINLMKTKSKENHLEIEENNTSSVGEQQFERSQFSYHKQ